MSGAEFYYPERAVALFVILLLVFFIVRSHKLRRAFGEILKTNKSLDRSHSFHAPKNRFAKEIIFILALVFLALALMRPRWGEKERKRKIQSVDLCIALDLSQSMLSEDMTPNRLKFAKRELTLLLDKLGDYRVSLVGFAGGAFIASPLTMDVDATQDILAPLNTDFVSMPSTYLEGALVTCAESLGYKDVTSKEAEDDKTSAGVVLLVTDGDDNIDLDSDIVKGFKRKKITINSYLVGKDQAVQIPLRDDMGNLVGFVKDPDTGAVATTKIETKKVKELSDATGGTIYMANQIADFGTLFRGDLKKFESKAREEGVEIEKEEQFQIPLLICLILLFAEVFLTETGELWPGVRKKYFNFVWILFFLSFPAHSAGLIESVENNIGVILFSLHNYADAQKWFQDSVESSPENRQFVFNWASARLTKVENDIKQLLADGKIDPKQLAQSPSAVEAAELSKLIDSLAQKETDPVWKKKWNFQLGNAFELSGQNGPAINSYYDALNDPAIPNMDVAAKHNLARLLKANSQSGGSGSGDGSGGGGAGKQGGSDKDQDKKDQGNQQKPQDYKGQNFTPDQVKQILQNVGSEERNVIKKKSREESQKKSTTEKNGIGGAKPW